MPRIVRLLLTVLALASPGAGAEAQAWPDKPIRFIVPSPPGGGTNSLTRLLANKLGETLKWQMVVDNRPGAGGNLGLDIAAKAAPDGYTLVMGESSNLAINPYLYKKLPFDPAKDVTPVALVGTVPLVLVVSANAPFEFGEGAGRRREEEAAHLRLVRQRHRRPSGRRDVETRRGRRHAARALQGRGPGDDRPGGRAGRPALRLAAGGAAPDRKRQAARAGDDVGRAPAVAAQRADADRGGLSGLRLLRVLRRARAGRHARRHRRQAQYRDRPRDRVTRHAQGLRRARRRRPSPERPRNSRRFSRANAPNGNARSRTRARPWTRAGS